MLDSVRLLCPLEVMHVEERSRAVLTVGVEGVLDLAVLNSAWSRILDQHPTVASRIVPHGDGYALESLAERPVVVELQSDDDVLTAVASWALPVGAPVARLFAAVDGAAATVGLSVDHVATDAKSALSLFTTLWQHYAAVLAGQPAPPAAKEWPATVSSQLPEVPEETVQALLTQRLERARTRPVPLVPYHAAGADAPPPGQQPVHNTRVTLSPEQTADLAAGARSLDTTVHGVVAAALLLATHDALGGGETRALGCLSSVDLRSRVEPPVPADVMLSYVSPFPDVLDVAGDLDLDGISRLARQVIGHLRDATADGGWAVETALLGHLGEHPELMDTTLFVSNMGRIDGPPSPPGLRLHDAMIIPGREDYFPQFGMGPLFACVTAIDGVFAIDLPYTPVCFAPAQMERVRARTLAALEQVVAAGARATQPA
ncbi:hypothetical protein AB0878_26470 [Amycolatopsis sp. NPDC047767]|uniref:phthiocerol/phthiodiolone dimycocerosyl transferase family protein n=1 Tax=Amycolatopsis sp. NPDC047767 TaxID=3156765 RepID=UPI0034571941